MAAKAQDTSAKPKKHNRERSINKSCILHMSPSTSFGLSPTSPTGKKVQQIVTTTAHSRKEKSPPPQKQVEEKKNTAAGPQTNAAPANTAQQSVVINVTGTNEVQGVTVKAQQGSKPAETVPAQANQPASAPASEETAPKTEVTVDDIDGIGPKRRKALIAHFGGLQGIADAGIDQLTAVPGISRELAEKIYAALH